MDAYLRLDTMPEALKVEDLKTAPFDPRFPNTNQTRYCYQSYLDYYRCQKIRGTDYKPCDYFKKVFHSICPNAWIEKWDSQREEGTFAGNI
ncbi:cytochrome c oxidase subunit 6B1 isoform X1 [Zophobas morio]|uniref:cytochrome c oxidase subunit 6B1 isoform X1 n=2 Tax=Zophobas morio TaxID=2755281 RepID=UPI003082C7F4